MVTSNLCFDISQVFKVFQSFSLLIEFYLWFLILDILVGAYCLFFAIYLFASTFLQKITFVICLYTVCIICFGILVNAPFRQFLFVLLFCSKQA